MKEFKASDRYGREVGFPIEPKVSVIIPTYNREELIGAAIQSVLAQTYTNVEIIVIDDGSTDNTKNVLERFKGMIRYLWGQHKGTAHARNMGMEAATGKYIAFLDSDDQYYPYKLQVQVEFIESHPEIGMVYTEFSGVEPDGSIDPYHIRKYHPNYEKKGWSYEDIFSEKGEYSSVAVEQPIPFYMGNVFSYTLFGTFISSNTMLFSKEVLKKVGYQNEAYQYGEDYDFTVRIAKYCRAAFLDLPTYKLFYHDNQSTRFAAVENSRDPQKITKWIGLMELFIAVVMENGYNDPEFYSKNKVLVDDRLLSLYCDIGKRWLSNGDSRKARECFKESKRFGSMQSKYRRFYWLSFFPSMISKLYHALGYNYKKVMSSLRGTNGID
jgi:glycosyltransferase involved in cell wall biosynthesis